MRTSKRRLDTLDARLSALEAQREAAAKWPRVITLCGVGSDGEIASFSALVIGGPNIQPEPGESLEQFTARCEEVARSLPALPP